MRAKGSLLGRIVLTQEFVTLVCSADCPTRMKASMVDNELLRQVLRIRGIPGRQKVTVREVTASLPAGIYSMTEIRAGGTQTWRELKHVGHPSFRDTRKLLAAPDPLALYRRRIQAVQSLYRAIADYPGPPPMMKIRVENEKTPLEIEPTLAALTEAIQQRLAPFGLDVQPAMVHVHSYNEEYIITVDGYGVFGFTDQPLMESERTEDETSDSVVGGIPADGSDGRGDEESPA